MSPAPPSPEPPDAAPALREGRYRLLEVLGQGGMATVYRGLDTRLGVQRAIKMLQPELAARPRLRQRFEDEARTMARLSHPHIVAVQDVDHEQGRVFLVMELLEGGTLWDWVQRHGPMPPKLAVDAILPVLDALAHAHRAGVVHRDVKPQNVLLSGDGVPRLTDFGIARVDTEGSGTRTSAVMGTWTYMPPEQRRSARDVDARADLYAVGAMLYALVRGEDPPDLFAADLDPSILAPLPAPLADVVRSATRYSRDERYADATAMGAALLSCRGALPEIPEALRALAPAALRALAPAALGEAAPLAGILHTLQRVESTPPPISSSSTSAPSVSASSTSPPPPPAAPTVALEPDPVPPASSSPTLLSDEEAALPAPTLPEPDDEPASPPPRAPVARLAAALLLLPLALGAWWLLRGAPSTDPLPAGPAATAAGPAGPTDPARALSDPAEAALPIAVEPEPASAREATDAAPLSVAAPRSGSTASSPPARPPSATSTGSVRGSSPDAAPAETSTPTRGDAESPVPTPTSSTPTSSTPTSSTPTSSTPASSTPTPSSEPAAPASSTPAAAPSATAATADVPGTPTPPPSGSAGPPGRVSVSGSITRAELVDLATGQRRGPGELPAGSYRLEVRFNGDTQLTPVGTVRVISGFSTSLTCSARSRSCQ